MKKLKDILKQFLVLLLIGEMCTFAFPVNAADITIDTSVPAGNRPTIDKAQNGVTIINLSKTTAGGVSYNKFGNYNVGPNGLILNNSKNMGISVLGGAIYGNPNYQCNGKEASIVINEVTGSKRSSILGTTEMFGKSAEFILVNPNGIYLNGAGFINMPRVTLGTGTPVFDSGEFRGININGGGIFVEGDGIDAGKVNYFDIVTRMASLNGTVWGKDVNINTGTGYYNYSDKSFTQNNIGGEKPEYSIDASAFGSIYSGRISIISNESGVGVRSKADMLADVSDIRITADGRIELKNVQAAKDISVSSASGGIFQEGDAFAMRSISYNALGVTNRGRIEAVNGLILSGLIDNQNGTLRSGGNIDIGTAGILNNINGQIISSSETGNINIHGNGNLDIIGGDVKSAGGIDINMTGDVEFDAETGSIYADKNFSLTSKTFTNSITLSMNGAIDIETAGFIKVEDGAEIISNSGVNLSTGGAVTNSGIISGDFVNITGSILENNSGSEITGGYGSSNIDINGNIDNRGRISGVSDLSVKGVRIINYDIDSEISSGKNLSITADALINSEGLLFSGEALKLRALSLLNTRGFIYSMGNMEIAGNAVSGNSLKNYSGYIESEKSMTINLGADGKFENTGEDTGNYTKTLVTYGGYGDDHWNLMKRYELDSTMETESSFLISGTNMEITAGEVKNHGSVISSGGNLTINADSLINETQSRDVDLAKYELWGNNVESKKKIKKGKIKITIKWITEHHKKDEWRPGTVEVVSNDKALIQADGSVKITAGSVFNGTTEDFNDSNIYNDKDEIESTSYNPGSASGSGKTGIYANSTSAIENIQNTGAIDLSKYINIGPNGNAMFKIDANPGSMYLIETRNRYIDVDKLKGSQYLLDRIGYNPETAIKFLGDAYYEQKLVSEAVLKATSRKYLEDSLASDKAQMDWLLENAASAYSDLKLAVGVALTKDQINKLQQPIVWYVTEEIMGVQVLAPKIYIPEHIIAGFSKNSGSAITGNSVTVNSTGDVVNSGLIKGNTSVDISAVNITNRSTTGSAEITGSDVNLTAQNSITNRSAIINGDKSVSLTAVNGDIINETEVFVNEYDWQNGNSLGSVTGEDKRSNDKTDIYSTLGLTASIKSGGSLTVNTGGNFTNRGAEVKAGGDADITAAGNIDFETVKLRNRTIYEGSNTSGVEDKSTSTGSNLIVGGNLKLTSGRDINFIGSSADIAGNADVKTEGNFNLINDYDTSYYDMKKTDDGMASSKTTRVIKSTSTVVGSNFNTGGDLNVDSGNNINIVGSDINAGGDSILNADGTLNIIAVHDESYFSKTTKKSGFGAGDSLYGSVKTSDMVYDRMVNNSAVDIKGNYASKSGGDTNITGSTITVGGAADITTGGNLNITAAYNEHEEEHVVEQSGVGSGGHLYGSVMDAEGRGSRTVDPVSAKDKYSSTTGVASLSGEVEAVKSIADVTGASITSLDGITGNLKKGDSGASFITAGKLTLNSGNDILIEGSKINAGSADITAAGNFTETAAQESSYEYKIHQEVTVGLSDLKDSAKDLFKDPKSFDTLWKGEDEGDRGRVSKEVGKATYENTTEKTDTIGWSASEININDTLNINSGKDITIAASNISAGGDVSLNAAGDVNIETRDETVTNTVDSIKGEAVVSVGVKHTSSDVYYATKDLQDAKDAYDKGKKSYDSFKKAVDKAEEDYKNKLITKDELDSIKEDEKFYQLNIAMLSENMAAKTAALAQAVVGAMSSGKTYGFQADVQLEVDGTKTTSRDFSSTAIGSNISTGGNFKINSGKTAKIEGSNVSANGDIEIDAKNVEIIAGVNESDSRSETTHIQGTASLNTSTGFSFSISGDKTWTGAESVSYTNSQLSGNNIKIKSSSDTLVSGAVVTAANNLDLDIGGNLTVESKQDTSKSHSVTIGASGGGSSSESGTGANKVSNSSGGNGGVNFNISKSSSKWVNEQTSLTGGTVNIYVENKTTLTGAVIASTTGDLKLDTGSFEYSNLLDKNRSYGIGGGVGGGYNTNYDKPPDDRTSASYNLDGNYSLSDKRQKNFATIGEGTIIVRDASAGSATGLEGLNRDVSIAQYETKKETGFEGNFRIDNTTVEMIGNTVDAIMNPQQAAEDLAKKAEQAYTDVAGTTSLIIAEGGELVDKSGNLVTYGDFETASDLKMTDAEYIEWQAYKQKEEEQGLSADYTLNAIETNDKDKAISKISGSGLAFINNMDGVDFNNYLDSENGKFLQNILDKGGDLYNNKNNGKTGNNYPSQYSVDCDSPTTACTFTSDYIAASIVTDKNMKPINDVAELADGKVTDSKMIVNDNNEVARLGGATDVKIENTATYVDTGKKGATTLSNADATADMIKTINEGGVLVARVGDTPGKPVGHSIVFSGYSIDNSGSVVINVIDPAKKYDHYDPVTQNLYKIDENGDREDDQNRKIINYLHVTKK
jgi:filamentous hemagglutinin family protein